MASGGESSAESSMDGSLSLDGNSDPLTPLDYHQCFNPDDYLHHFFDQEVIERGTKLVLFALPNLICRIPFKNARLLDVGSGPTTYVALCCRNVAATIHLSDYALQNCEELVRWKKKEEPYFNWEYVCRNISNVEGDPMGMDTMEDVTRSRVEAVWQCDVHHPQLLKTPAVGEEHHKKDPPDQFDMVTTIFCLESACQTYEEYCKAVGHVACKVRPGGYFIICSVIEDDVYEFGPNNKFTLLYLTIESVHKALEAVGLDVCIGPGGMPLAYEHDGAYMVMAKKRENQ